MAKLDALTSRFREDQERQDYHAGLICSVTANVNRNRDSRAFEPRDFMPIVEPQKIDANDWFDKFSVITAAFGGKIERLN